MNSESTRQDPSILDIYQDPSNVLSWQKQVCDEKDAEETKDSQHTEEDKFTSIASNINETLNELTEVYSLIGYSNDQIAIKKSEIFVRIESTIREIANSLNQEKTTIENECKWLRQQIRRILEKIDDPNGAKSMNNYDRGLVTEELSLCALGYNEQVQQASHHDIILSPFDDPELSLESSLRPAIKRILELSLLEVKHKLEQIFLSSLKTFSGPLWKLSQLAVDYWSKRELIGDFYSEEAAIQLSTLIPTAQEAQLYMRLLTEFDSITSANHRLSAMLLSPSKNKFKDLESVTDSTTLLRLRNLTRDIIQAISCMKTLCITQDTLVMIQKETDACELEVQIRQKKVQGLIDKCISLIDLLQVSEDQLIDLQRQFDALTSAANESVSSDGYFDFETLRFIKTNPTNFGLNDEHISYLQKFADFLQRRKDIKQKKYDAYLTSCTDLWTKLGETQEYVDIFLAANNTLSDVSLLNFKLELNKLYVKRLEHIENFISDARKSIEKLWDQMHYSDSQRMPFKYYNYDARVDVTDKETVLSEHEEELKRLTEEYSKLEPVLTLWDQITDLLKDLAFLKESSRNSSRLLSKDSCKILLNEEKIRKNINKNLPKLVCSLKAGTISYNKSAREPLQIDGEDLLEKLNQIETEHNLGASRQRRVISSNSSTSSAPSSASSQKSPIRKPLRASPNKVPPRVPLARSNNQKDVGGRKRPALRASNSNLSSKVNPTTIRLTNAYHSSIVDMPLRSTSAEIDHKSRDARMHLQPLHTPLVSLDSTSPSKLSPLRASTLNTINSSQSPNSTLANGKENLSPIRSQANTKLDELSPVRLNTEGILAPITRRESVNTCDSSTLIGDDYEIWRDERIQQYNIE